MQLAVIIHGSSEYYYLPVDGCMMAICSSLFQMDKSDSVETEGSMSYTSQCVCSSTFALRGAMIMNMGYKQGLALLNVVAAVCVLLLSNAIRKQSQHPP